MADNYSILLVKEIDMLVTFDFKCDDCKEVTPITLIASDYLDWFEGRGSFPPLVQDVFHYLTDHEREMIKSLTCKTCFNIRFPLDNE